MQISQQVNNEGRTVVMVTHETDIARFAKRMVIVRDGKIVEDTPVNDRRMHAGGEQRIAHMQAG